MGNQIYLQFTTNFFYDGSTSSLDINILNGSVCVQGSNTPIPIQNLLGIIGVTGVYASSGTTMNVTSFSFSGSVLTVNFTCSDPANSFQSVSGQFLYTL